MIYHVTDDPKEMFRTSAVSDLFLTTSNSVIRVNNRTLVMGAGHAKAMVQHFDPEGKHGLEHRFALKVQEKVEALHGAGFYPELRPNDVPYGYMRKSKKYLVYYSYGVIISENWPKSKLGLFQTKDNWLNKSRLGLIEFSVRELVRQMKWMQKVLKRAPRVDMPFPGIGNGGLKEYDVRHLLKNLEDNVHIWKLVDPA